MKRRVALRVLGKGDPFKATSEDEGDMPPGDLSVELAGHRKPKTRGDCSPQATTVDCPVVACGALAGAPCLQFDPQDDTPEALRTYPALRDIAGKRVEGPPHYARIEAARAHLRPCPWTRCKFHLYLDVDPETGAIIFNYPNKSPLEIPYTCGLDLAEYGGLTLEMIGEVVSLTRERIRQLERKALDGLRSQASELVDVDDRKLNALAAAARTTFDRQPVRRAAAVGRCPTCGQARFRIKSLWRCACRLPYGTGTVTST